MASRGERLSRTGRSLIVSFAILGSCTACSESAPTGQVVATVGDEEITRRDVAAELAVPGLYPPGDEAARTRSAIQSIIDRKLVAAEARRQGLDREPTYLASSLRSGELLLGSEMVRRWSGTVRPPTPKDIAAMIASQPHRFADRALVEVAQVTSPRALARDALGTARTPGEIEQQLTEQGIPFDMARLVIDTGTLDSAAAARLRAAEQGAPIVESSPRGTTMTVVTQIRPAALSPAAARALAAQLMTRDALQRRVRALRTRAEISYQPGLRPSAPGR